MRKIFALITNQGTAAAETAICSDCDSIKNRNKFEVEADEDVLPDSWRDCTANDYLKCNLCGK